MKHHLPQNNLLLPSPPIFGSKLLQWVAGVLFFFGAMVSQKSLAQCPSQTFTVSGGGAYCAGGTGVTITLDGSESGVDYWLINGVPADVTSLPGTGAALSFTNITGADTYTIEARGPGNTCPLAMTGSAAVAINALPGAPTGPVDGDRCGTGTVGLSATVNAGETIDWYAASSGGAILAGGTGTTSFNTPSISATTTYYAQTRNTTTGCISATRTAVTATVNTIPAASNSPVDGQRCGTGTVLISASIAAGETIDWYAAASGGAILAGGTGTTSFTTPSISTTTTYYAETRNTTTGCISATRTAVTATVNAVPAAPNSPVDGQRCGTGTVIISASIAAGETIDWYAAASGGSVLAGGTGTTSFTTPSISATTTYYAETRNTTTGCISATRTAVTATVNTVPALSTAGNNSRCGTGTVTITATPGAGETIDWYAAASGGAILAGGTGTTSFTTPSISATTTYYAETRNTTTGCISATRRAVTATVNAIPAAPNSPVNGQRCGTGTVTISAASPGGTTIDWYAAASGGSVLAGGTGTASFTTPSISATTSYYAETRNTTTGCISATRTAVTATVNTIPAAPTSPVNGQRCGTGTVVISASIAAGETIDWYAAASGGSVLAGGTGTTSFTTPSISATTSYYAQTRNTTTGCISATRTAVTATVNTVPALSTAGNNSRCGTGTVTITATPGAGETIDWYAAASGGSVLAGGTGTTSFTTPSISATTTYYAETRNTTTGCISATRRAVIATVNAIPAAPNSPVNGQRCGTGTVTISAASPGGTTIDWYAAASGGSVLAGGTGTASFTTPSISATTSYYAETRNTTTGCISATRTAVTATVNTIPAAPTSPVNGQRCGTGTVVISASIAAGETIDWYAAASGGSVLAGGTGTTSFTTPSISATTTYYAQTRNTTTGCISATRTAVTATVNTVPALSTAGNNSRCGTGTVTITATPGAGETIDWYAAASGGSVLAGGTGTTSFTTPSISATTTYYAETRNTTTGCISATRRAVIATVNAIPAGPNSPVNGQRCGTGTVTISAASPGGTTIDWYAAASGGSVLAGGTGTASFTTPSISATTSYYAETRNTTTGCISATRTAVTATVNTIPAAPTSPVNGQRCGTGTVVISASIAAGETIDWYAAASGGSVLAGGTGTTSFTTPSISATTSYYAQTRNTTTGCISATRLAVTATVNTVPAAPTSPVNGQRCGTGTVTISATSPGGTTIDWYAASSGGSVLAGGTGTTSFNTPSISATTTYYAQTRNTTTGCISATRTAVTATVNTIPAAPNSPVDGQRCGTGTVLISASIAAGETIDWYAAASGGAILAGGTGTTSFTTPSISATTTYYAETRNTTTGCISATRTAVTATVNAVPAAPNSPVDGQRCGTGTVIISASIAAGETIDWYAAASGGSVLAGGTGTTSFTTPSISATTTYYAETRNTTTGCISATRTAVTATVNPIPTMTSASTATICDGGTVNISLTSSVASSYTWIAADNPNTIGESLTLQNSSTLNDVITNNTTSVQTVTYTVSPTSTPEGCVGPDQIVTVSVYAPPVITVQPDASQTVCNTYPVTFTVAATGDGLTYQWYKGATALTDNAFITGSNTATLTIDPTDEVTDEGTYHVLVSGLAPCADATSADAVLNIDQIISITTQPLATQTFCEGQTATFSVASTGSNLGYQWRTGATDLVDGGNISGATGPTLTISNLTTADATSAATRYNVKIIDAAVDPGDCNTAFSNNASLVVNKKSLDPTSVTTNGGITTICNGSSTILTLNGGGGGTGETIHWYSGSCGGTAVGTGNNISVSPTSTTTYYGRYEDPAPCSYSSACASVTVTVNQKSADPTSATATPALICNGQSTTLTLNGGGGGDAETIKWYTASCGGTLVGSGDGLVVSPATTTTYYGRYEDAAPCSYYTACVSVTVTVNQKSANPTSVTAASTTICIGGSTALTLNGGGGGTDEVITWYSGSCGGTLEGTGNGLSVSPAAATTYYGRYEDAAPCSFNTTCASVTITVNQPPTTSDAGTDQTVCATTATLAGNTPTVGAGTWTRISGAGAITTPGSPASGITGLGVGANVFRWTITNAPCTSSFDEVIITRSGTPTTANAGTDQTVCATSATLNGNNPATGTGTWSVVSGPAGYTFGNVNVRNTTFSNASLSSSATYVLRWTISNPPCTASTDDVSITLNPPIAGDSIYVQSLCRDQSTGLVTLFLNQKPPGISGGSGTYTYSWEVSCNGGSSWSVISGATNASLILPQSAQNCFYRRAVTSPPCALEYSGTVLNNHRLHINLSNTFPASPFSITPFPAAAYCAGGPGIQVGTSGSLVTDLNNAFTPYDVWYKLYLNGVLIDSLRGTGSALNFGYKTAAGTYTATETITLLTAGAASCSPTTLTNSLAISIDANVTPSNAGSPQTVCANVTMAANTPIVGTGTWSLVSGAGTITTPTSPTTTITGLATGANVFKWKITNGTCADSSNVTITAYQPNVAGTPAANLATICNGGSSALSQTGGVLGTGAKWQWYTDASYSAASKIGVLLTGAASLAVSPSTTTTYYLRAEGATAPCQVNTPSGNVTVNVNPRPTSVISGTAPICFGGSTPITIVLTGTQPWSLTYISSNTGVSTVVNGVTTSPYTFNPSPGATTTYTVTALADANCTSVAGDRTGSATVTVNPLPTATIAGTTTVCQDDASPGVTFTGANGTAPYTFTYTDYLGNTQTAVGSPSSVAVAGPPTSAAGSFTYTLVSVQDGSTTTCSQNISGQAVTITVNPKPVIDDPQASLSTCAGSSPIAPVITGTIIPAGTTYTWGAPAMTGGMTVSPLPGTGTNQAFTTGTFTNTTTSIQKATYTITPQSGAGCTGASFTLVVNVSPSIAGTAVWLGTTSTDWCTASNWSCGVVPSSSVSAIIPAGPTNMPVIDGSCAAFVKDLDVQAGATLDLTAGNSLSIFGEFINQDESVFNLDGTVNFAGGNQDIPAFTYYGLQVTGGGNKTLLGDVIINGPLILTNGVIVSSPTKMLTISATGSVTAGSDQSYINGPLTRETDQPVTYFFPVGGGGVIRVASVTPKDNTLSSYTVYYQTPTPAGPMGGADLFGTQTGEYWDVTKNFGIDAIPGFYYKNPNGLPAGASTTDWTTGINSCSFCNVAVTELTGGTWYYTGGITYSGGFAPTESTYWQSNGYVDARVPITDNNTPHQYSFGYGYAIVLPVTLLDFTGTLQGNNALLKWSFAPGSDVASTELQHSTDGQHFGKLTVKTAGSFNAFDYMHFNLQPGAHYYRLLIKDKAGKLAYSKTVLLVVGKNITIIKGIRPTMVRSETFVEIHSAIPQAVHAVLFDMAGRTVAEYRGSLQEGENSYRISTILLAQGLYTLQVKTTDGVQARLRFMKE